MTKAEYAEYEEAVKASLIAHNITGISTSLEKCPDCDVEFECSECPSCGKDAGEFPNEPYVSHQDCDLCGDGYQGNRLDAVGYNMNDKNAPNVPLCICEDCEYYMEYGRLSDKVMDEMEE